MGGAMTADRTEVALLAAILADPADDTLRLVYADWLDENAEGVTCPRCSQFRYPGKTPDDLNLRNPTWLNCDGCDGTAMVPDGRPERAEFIRVQVGLAKWPQDYRPATEAEDAEVWRLVKRERELWNYGMPGTWVDTIAPPFDCIQCIDEETVSKDRSSVPVLIYRRGFVSRISLTAAAFLGEAGGCRGCAGWGGWGTPEWAACPDCTGTGRTPGIAGELFAAHPVERVTLSDREPLPSDNVLRYSWHRGREGERGQADLPDEVFYLLPNRTGNYSFHHTRDAALAALSAACVRHGRSLAGLPPLPSGQPAASS